MEMIIILLGWLSLILVGLKFQDRGIEEALGVQQCKSIKGICAIEILIGHIGLATGNSVLYINRKAGVLFVGIFFFLSGYGLIHSKEHKPDYMKRLFIKKAAFILGLAYVVYVIFQVVDYFQWKNVNYLYYIINPAQFFHSNNWFVWEILLLYMLFGLMYKIQNRILANGIFIILSLTFVAFGFAFKIENPWYGSTLCFMAGIMFYQYRERLSVFLKKYWWISVLTGTVLVMTFTAAFFILGNESIMGNPVSRNLAAIFFCITITTVLCKVHIGNKVTAFLGSCSYEIYLIHPYVLAELRERIVSPFIYAMAVIMITIILAYFIFITRKWLGKIRNAKHV